MNDINYKYRIVDGDQTGKISQTSVQLNNLLKQVGENSIYDNNVIPTPPAIGGSKNKIKNYIINNKIKFSSDEINVEKIAAKLIEPKRRNIEYVFTIREVNNSKNNVYKLIKNDGKIKKIVFMHN
jgi:hypothetical protein